MQKVGLERLEEVVLLEPIMLQAELAPRHPQVPQPLELEALLSGEQPMAAAVVVETTALMTKEQTVIAQMELEEPEAAVPVGITLELATPIL